MKKMIETTLLLACLLFSGNAFAAGALSVSREAVVNGSPASVWKLVGQFNALDVWHPAVVNSAMKGSGTKVGSTRLLTLGNAATINEKLTAYSAGKHSYSYAITKSPLPVKNYVSTISLAPTSDGKTLMKWSSSFDAAGESNEKALEAIQGIYDAGLGKVVSIMQK